MSDDPGIHHPVAHALQEAREMTDQIERSRGPSRPSVFFGEGIGPASNWGIFFGIIGAILGGLVGQSLLAAAVTGLVFAAVFGAIAFVGGATMRFWNRGPVILWVFLGAVAFFVLGALMNSEPINWAVFGAMLGAAFRILMKDKQ